MVSTKSRPELLVITGETASGKSALAHQAAKEFNGEIIAADSWTVYKGFDIGTSKPTKEEQAEVRYHLLDVVEAPEGFNAPKFKELAERAIDNIQNRGKLPIMVGGTGLYIDSMLYDFGFLPDVPPERRAELDAMSLRELLDLAKEQGIDLAGVDMRNKRRIIRAIEARGEKPSRKDLRAKTVIVGLQLPRDELQKRIEQRVEQMVEAGFMQEVKGLSEEYGWDIEPMKGIGYRAFRDYIEGRGTLDEAKARFVKGDLGLAKRQRTWFKRNPDIQWFSSAGEAYSYLRQVLSN